MEDIDLIRRAKSGEEAAWTALVSSHQEALFRFAYLYLGDAAEAEDIAQEAFIRAYRHRHRFESGRPYRPWLLGIVANLARNRKRSLGRYWKAIQRYWKGASLYQPNLQAQDNSEGEALWQAIRRLST